MIGPFPIVVVVMIALLAGSWWARRQSRESQRQTMRAIHTLSERIIAASSVREIAENLTEVLPTITQASSVRLFLYNRANKSLESIALEEHPEPMAILVADPAEGLAKGAAKCFSSRSVVHIPDARRNPLVSGGWIQNGPRSAMYIPVSSKNECLGVLEAGNKRGLGYFTPEEQAALQHLANQVATSITLQAQQAVREQLFRSEKLAATGQLISGIANELKAPLETIVELSGMLASTTDRAPGMVPELRQLAAESRRASEIVARLVSFARPEDSAGRPVDVNAVVSELAHFREPQWKEHGLRVQNKLGTESAFVLGARGQLEQVLLNILVHAEQSAASASGKSVSISSNCLGGRVVIEIQYSSDTPSDSLIAAENAGSGLGLDVCRGVLQNHGGEIRLVTHSGGVGLEVDLPLADGGQPRQGAPARKGTRSLTLMVVDSDISSQRQMVGLLAARGHRVVPAAAEQAADLAQRMRFDALLWAVRAGGSKWSESHERLRAHVPAFVLVSDGYHSDLAASLAESGGFLLSRPVQEEDLDRILQDVETQTLTRSA
ncbi:MAG: GAF domain-containing protein [Bryobacteraceae bacterium]